MSNVISCILTCALLKSWILILNKAKVSNKRVGRMTEYLCAKCTPSGFTHTSTRARAGEHPTVSAVCFSPMIRHPIWTLSSHFRVFWRSEKENVSFANIKEWPGHCSQSGLRHLPIIPKRNRCCTRRKKTPYTILLNCGLKPGVSVSVSNPCVYMYMNM